MSNSSNYSSHNHHHTESFSEKYKRHAFSSQRRNKLIEKALTIILTIACLVLVAYIYWLYSTQ